MYTSVTTNRLKFQTRFQPEHHFGKLFGANLTSNEAKRLKSDPNFRVYNELQKMGLNSVLVVEALVDIFLDEVWKAVPMEQSFMPFVIERAKRAATSARHDVMQGRGRVIS